MFLHNKNKVERAISEIRRGVPILLYDKNSYLLFVSAELLEEDLFNKLKIISNKTYITLTGSQVQYSSQGDENDNKRLLINRFDELVFFTSFTKENLKNCELEYSRTIDEYAISLLKLSELLPCALLIDMSFKDVNEMQSWCKDNDVIELNKSLFNEFQHNQDVYEVCRTQLFLKQNKKASIVSYRTCNGQKEHYAIIIGNLSSIEEPLVRIHSSCYTGDLLDSLSCDCGSQLHKAISIINDYGGGIILYLMQDGRGIGLINKLRAYSIQKKYDLDTVDANRILGFDDDERSFVIAAQILKKLKTTKLQLLTNNDKKLSELEIYGIKVTKRVPLIVKSNEYNYNYMKTKCDKLGHRLTLF